MKCSICKVFNKYPDDEYERFWGEEEGHRGYYVRVCPCCMGGVYQDNERSLGINQRELDLAEANKKISELILERDNKLGEKDATIKNLTQEVDLLNMNIQAGVKRWKDLYKSREELKVRLKSEIELNKELRSKIQEKIPDDLELIYYKDLAEKWYQEKMGWRERCLKLERREKAREGRERIKKEGERKREGEESKVFLGGLIEVRTSIFVPEGCIRVDGVDYRVEGEGKEGEK